MAHRRQDSQASTATALARRGPRLSQLPSNVSFSIVTDTNSTTSSIYGPGRTIGAILSASGRRLEGLFNRTAERLGYGPNAVMQRILTSLRTSHERICSRKLHPGSPPSHTPLPFAALIDEAAHLASALCLNCRRPFMMDIRPPQDVSGLAQKMLGHMSQSILANQFLAVHYLHALAMIDDSIRLVLLQEGAKGILTTALSHASTAAWTEEEWSSVEMPIRSTLQVLSTSLTWFSAFRPWLGQGTSIKLCSEIITLVNYAKFVIGLRSFPRSVLILSTGSRTRWTCFR
jgi:hypothetical protein